MRGRDLRQRWLAYRQYLDTTRASKVVALNDAPHPLFMPTSGKVLAGKRTR
jgi:prophage DNA circulation protein